MGPPPVSGGGGDGSDAFLGRRWGRRGSVWFWSLDLEASEQGVFPWGWESGERKRVVTC